MSTLEGQIRDMGDIIVQTRWILKGKRFGLVFHVGSHTKIPPAERPLPVPPTHVATPGRIDLIMDLGADQKVQLTATYTDELGHPVTTPEGTTTLWSVDNTTVISLIDEDPAAGSIWAAATGELGNAIVSLSATLPNGATVTGDLLLSVVPGAAERVTITAGTPEEVTPDTPPTP